MISIAVLSGFLGSGKTSLINRLIRERPKWKIGVIVNETGDNRIESSFFSLRTSRLSELPGSCISCLHPSQFEKALNDLTKKDKPDLIIIEVSGLSELSPVLSRLTGPSLSSKFRLSSVINVLDAENYFNYSKTFNELKDQIKLSGWTLVSKLDRAEEGTWDKVSAFIETLKPGMPLIDMRNKIEWENLFDPENPMKFPRMVLKENESHRHSEILQWIYTQERPLDPVILGQVIRDLPSDIIRGKGSLYLKHPSSARNQYLFQLSGAQKILTAHTWKRGEPRITQLLFTGKNFSVDELKQKLDSCAL